VVFAYILPKFSVFIFRSSQESPDLQGSPDHEDTTRNSSVEERGYLKETDEVACVLSVLTLLKMTYKTNCCFETLCVLTTEVRQCVNCKVVSGVYGVLQNTTAIQVLV
jgi:hypothetical protein